MGAGVPVAAERRAFWSGLSPVHRAILSSDGSFTILLGALVGRDIKVALIDQHMETLQQSHAVLGLRAGDRLLRRGVRLYAEADRNLAFAVSVVAIDRVPEPLANDLFIAKEPIGLLLRKYRMETFREILDWGTAPVPDPAKKYFSAPELMFRSYQIMMNKQPLMLITEFFAHELLSFA